MKKTATSKDLWSLLRKKGYKATPQRIHVLSVLVRATVPMNAEEISNALRRLVNNVTTYRTLASFEKTGLVRRVDFRKGSAFFELNNEHHHHLVCTQCGVIEDFEVCDVDNIIKKIINQSKKFKAVQEHAFELFGMCRTCAAH